MRSSKTSKATRDRLVLYFNCLTAFARKGVAVVSSDELSRAAGVTAATVRKDLSRLGRLGIPGTGYVVRRLLHSLAHYVSLSRQWPLIIVGYGKLGRALADYHGFAGTNFRVVAAFDVDVNKIGITHNGFAVYPLQDVDSVVRDTGAELAIIATPPSAAQSVADRLVAAGVKSILNCTSAQLTVPEGVALRDLDPAREMRVLSFYETLRDAHYAGDLQQIGAVERRPAMQLA